MKTPAFSPHTLMLIPSMRCQAACKYCFGPHEGGTMPSHVLDAAAGYSAGLWKDRRDRQILFHGGEPLLAGHEWFERSLERLSASLNHRVHFSIQSNLWHLDQRFVDLLARYQVSIGTSIDGDRAITDGQRGEGYFDRCIAGIRLLRENGMEVSAIATVTPASLPRIPEIFEFFKSEELPFSLRGAVPTLAGGCGAGDLFLSAEEDEKLHEAMFGYLEAHPETCRVHDAEAMVRGVFAGRSPVCTFSECLGRYAAVDTAGRLYTCQRFSGFSEFSVGNVLDCPSEAKICESQAYRRIAAKYDEARESCGGCCHLEHCGGGCVYNMFVSEKYGRLPACRAGEGNYKRIFDGISAKLALEAADMMLSKRGQTPYLAMAGDKAHPADIRRNKRKYLLAYEWGKTKAPRNAFTYAPRREALFLNVTGNCPLHCPHCSVEAGAGGPDMPLELASSIARQAMEMGYEEVSINGGEPFIYGRFPALLEELTRMKRAQTRISLYTSLCCDIDEADMLRVLAAFDHIHVSLDGGEVEHDARRGRGSFSRTCANIARFTAAKRGCMLSVRASLTPEQYAKGVPDAVRQTAASLGVKGVEIKRVLPIGRAKSIPGVYKIETGPLDPGFFERPFSPRRSCGIGANLHVTPEGGLYPCWALTGEEHLLGSAEGGLEKVLRNYLWGSAAEKYYVDSVDKCRGCDVRYICGGICQAMAGSDCSALREGYLALVEEAKRCL